MTPIKIVRKNYLSLTKFTYLYFNLADPKKLTSSMGIDIGRKYYGPLTKTSYLFFKICMRYL